MSENGAIYTVDEVNKKDLLQAQYQAQVHVNSILSSRADLAQRAGYAFGTDRDYYRVLGYKRGLSFDDYLEKYNRQDIAARIVEAPAEDTWRDNPSVLDGAGEDTQDDTPFATAVPKLFDAIGAWADFEDVDILSGIGHFGILLIGAKGSTSFNEPLDTLPPGGLIYLQAYDEGAVMVNEIDASPESPRFGLPTLYSVNVGEDLTGTAVRGKRVGLGQTAVHWSRIIHVAEDTRRSNVYGTPRMRAVYNLLDDLLKVVGGSAEAVWKLVYMGMIITTKDGYKLPDPGSPAREALGNEVDEWVNDLRRVLTGTGLDVVQPGGQTVDPSQMVDVIISLIAAKTGIPKRLLLGAELGRVASTQDAANWAGRIKGRRVKFAESVILRPLIDRLIKWGTIPAPTNGAYSFDWRPLFEQDEKERADTAKGYAEALRIAGEAAAMGAVNLGEFRARLTPFPADLPMDSFDVREPEETNEPVSA